MKKYVICLKHGKKYGPEYVNTLAKMVKRNCTLDYEFVCYTEDPNGIDLNLVTIRPLPTAYRIGGWWFKPLLFNPDSNERGTMLYIDLDVIIFRNIDKLFTHLQDQFLVLRDFNRWRQPGWKKFNSSVVRWNTGQHPQIYKNFVTDTINISRRFHGDQDWLFAQVKKDFQYFPDEWIQSYKWEMRGMPPLTRDAAGHRNFVSPGVPKILPQTSIAVFHGDPNPKVCCDPWCKENWR